MQKYLPLAFAALLLILGVLLSLRIWSIHLLYIDSKYRSTATAALQKVADEQGWLLSDVEIRAAESNRLVITYRRHGKGSDETACHEILIDPPSLTPCAE